MTSHPPIIEAAKPRSGATPPGSTRKRVVAWRFQREPVRGFVNLQQYRSEEGLELLHPNGSVVTVPYAELKVAGFVSEFPKEDAAPTGRLLTSRPRRGGLWVRLSFRDGDAMDGILPNDLLLLGGAGIDLWATELSAPIQRLFIPRQALTDLTVLGVVGSPVRGKGKTGKGQLEMFGG